MWRAWIEGGAVIGNGRGAWRSGWRRLIQTAVVVAIAVASSAGGVSGAGSPSNWTAYLGGPLHDSYTADAQITRAAAAHVSLAWRWTPTAGTMSGQPKSGLYSSPTVYNHRIYVGANTGDFYALDEATGSQIWKRFLGFQPAITCPAMGFVSTAAVVDTSGTGASPIVYVAAPDGNLYALDGTTGSTVWQSVIVTPSTTTNDAFNWSSPTIVGDRIYIGFSSNCDSPFIRGGLAEFDRVTGARVATFYSVPAGKVGGGVWTSAAVASTGVYIATASGGSQTSGDSYSVIRLDPVTLARLGGWIVPLAQQAAGDADFGSSPIVFHATVGGVDTELVGACNKDGLFYVFANGDMSAPLWSYQVGAASSDGGSSCLSSGIWDGSRLYMAGNETTIGGVDYQGSIRQLDPATGTPIWERGLSANVLGAPSENGAGVIAASTFDYIPSGLTNQTYLLDSDTGSIIATINNSNAKEFAQPIFADQYLLLSTTNSIFAYTPDAQAPTVPTGLAVTPNGPNELDLSWTASHDNVGVSGYHVFRDGGATPIATTTTPTFADMGLAPGATHSYTVTAFDSSGNESSPTGPVSGTTTAGGGGVGLVQQRVVSGSGVGLTDVLGSASTSGDALVATVALAAGSSALVSGVTDSSGGVWTRGPVGFLTGTNSRVEVWYRLGASSVSSVSVTLSAARLAAVDVSEWSGVVGVDKSAQGNGASGTTVATPLLSTSAGSELVIGAVNFPAAATATLAGGFTSLSDFSSGTVGAWACRVCRRGCGWQCSGELGVVCGERRQRQRNHRVSKPSEAGPIRQSQRRRRTCRQRPSVRRRSI